MVKQKGFSLLELLLVLVCMAAIIAWAMHHYQQEQRTAQAAQVRSDVKSLQRALDTYFHVHGCDPSGNFDSTYLNVTCPALQPFGAAACSRSPLVVEYAPFIIKTDQTTTDSLHKPIYQLQITAVLANNLTAGQVTWYQQQLGAKPGASGGSLLWNSLPTNSDVQFGDTSWILNGAGAFFRATENQRDSSANNSPDYSGSYCAN